MLFTLSTLWDILVILCQIVVNSVFVCLILGYRAQRIMSRGCPIWQAGFGNQRTRNGGLRHSMLFQVLNNPIWTAPNRSKFAIILFLHPRHIYTSATTFISPFMYLTSALPLVVILLNVISWYFCHSLSQRAIVRLCCRSTRGRESCISNSDISSEINRDPFFTVE